MRTLVSILLLVVLICTLVLAYMVCTPDIKRIVRGDNKFADVCYPADFKYPACTDQEGGSLETYPQIAPLKSLEAIYKPDKLMNMLTLTLAKLRQKRLSIESRIREDKIHIQLLDNRGYGRESPEMIQRVTSKHSRQRELDRANDDIQRLEKRLQQVEQAAKDDTDNQHSRESNRVLDREWHMWLQNNLGATEALDSRKLLPFAQED